MGKRPNLSTEQKAMILVLHSAGNKPNQVAMKMGCSRSCAERWINRYEAGESVLRRTGSGKSRKLTALECRDILLKVKREPRITLREIREEIGRDDVCLNTIRRPIQEDGTIDSYWETNKVFVSKANQLKRVQWCKDHLDWKYDDWCKVLWSDESPFVLRYNCRQRVWRRHNERYHVKALKGSFKNDLKVMVWGCFCAHGVGRFHHITGIMDAKVFQRILDNELRPSAKKLFKRKPYIFQQDNDSKHKAKTTIEFLEMYDIDVMPWPAQSPDLNPIENLWSILDVRCKARKPTTVQALVEVLRQAWESLEVGVLENLVASMPQRLNAVIEAKGLPTHY